MPTRLAIVLAALAAIALLGAFVESNRSGSSAPATTSTTPKADPNRVVKSKGPLQGAILIADRGNNRVLLVDSHHRILWRFPTWADRARGEHLVFDDDTFVQPGGKELITNEENHQAILAINIKTHHTRLLFGEPGVIGHDMTHLNWPDDAYMLPGGTLTVADAYNCRILFIRNKRIVRQIGSGVCGHNPPATLGDVNGDTPVRGGGVPVSEIPPTGAWIDAFSKTGKLLWDFKPPVVYPSDPQPLPGGRILLTDYNPTGPGAVLIVNRHGRVLWRYGPTTGPGMLDHTSLAIMLPNGDIAVNDDYGHRVVIINPKTKRIVWHYGHHNVASARRGYLNTPDGMDYIPLGVNEKPLWQLVHHP